MRAALWSAVALASLTWAGGAVVRATGPAADAGEEPTRGASAAPSPAEARLASAAPTGSGFYAPSPSLLSAAEALLAPDAQSRRQGRPPYHEFFFTRAIYSDYGGGGRGSWAVDYPEADWHFVTVARRLANVDAYNGDEGNAVWLGDPELRRYPFLYALEVGRMSLTEQEVEGLRSYLAAGGFLIIDDFWGTQEWANFEREISRVLPGRPIVELGLDHPLFRIFYNIDEIRQVPGVRNGYNVSQGFGVTYERDGYTPHVRGIYDQQGRLMVVINWNTDLGDAWEHADDPFYPLQYSTYAFEVAMNLILFAMTH
jgi:hypothetical protein